jgi:hypothetical protein
MATWAQSNSVSPYSRFGLGDRLTSTYMQGFTMGQLSTALRDPLNLNLNNPAASNALRLTTLEMAGKLAIVNQSSNGLPTVQQTTASFNYFALGIPISENYGISFGALPYTAVGYRLSETEDISDIGRVTRQYQGTGGLNKVYLNQALMLFDRLSIGAQVSYYFGSIEYLQDVRYSNSSFLSSRYDQNYLISDVNWGFGLQYIHSIGENADLTFGAAWENSNELSGTFTTSAFTYTAVGSQALPRDTLDSKSSKEDLSLPNQLSLGLMYGVRHPDMVGYAWMVGFDFQQIDWSRFYSGEENTQELINSQRFSVGGEMVPRYAFKSLYRSRSFLSNLKYRAGAYLDQSPLELKGERINVTGMTFGIGIPLRVRGLAPGEERNNTINLGFNYAIRGTLNEGLIREEVTQIIFGVTLNDRWFIKYKYR